jgi:two-component system OmpR family sensor kinase
LKRWPPLSIFARSFLMMLSALLVSTAIGIAILVIRPPSPPPMASLFDVVSALQPDIGGFDRGAFSPGRAMGDPGRGPMPGFMPPGGGGDLDVNTADAPPQPPDGFDTRLSSHIAQHLADLLHVSPDALKVYAFEVDAARRPAPMRALMGPGSVIALHETDGHWRVTSVPGESFPSMLQQQLFWLLALGILVLLPAAWLFARALSAPIRHFAEAALRLGNDTHAPPVPREGPPEMRKAVDAFNGMQGRVNRLVHERTQMIAAIAHDLRTPLTRLSFRLDGLPQPLGAKVDADIQEMKTMISAALDFIRDRSLGAQRHALDFRLLIESVADDLVDVGHDVTVEPGPAVTLEGDPLALRRAIVNLVDNGLKYGHRVRLRIRATGGECTLEVDDDGPGIPETMQQQVFAPFFRLEASRNRDTGGIGLGLATVRAVVLDHGGAVLLRNRKLGGLRAVVTLPLMGHA